MRPLTGFRQLTVAIASTWLLTSGCAALDHLGGTGSDRGRHASALSAGHAPLPAPASCSAAGKALLARAETPAPVVPVVTLGAGNTEPVMARSTYDFVSSVGVNVHTTYTNTPYRNHARVAGALRELGIRHIRDGLMPDRDRDQYPFLRELANRGICASLIVGGRHVDADRIDDTLDDLAQVTPAVEFIEGPNEPDRALRGKWCRRVRAYQAQLAKQVNRHRELRGTPLLGPSFGRLDASRQCGEMSHVLDAGNIHPYPGGGPPSQTLRHNVTAARRVSGDLPLVATEHGYHNAVPGSRGHPGVPETVTAVYVPRLFLEAFASGIPRTYLYELLDEFAGPRRGDLQSNFGLLRHDYSWKPAAHALRNLLTIVGAHAARPHRTSALALAVESDARDVQAMLLQDAEGTYWLAVWRNVSAYDVARAARVDVAPAKVRVVLARPARASVFAPTSGARAVDRAGPTTHVDLSLGAGAQLIRLRKGASHV